MPPTNREKQRHFVEKLKVSGQFEEYKKKKAAAVHVKKCRENKTHQDRLLSNRARNQLDKKKERSRYM